MKKLTIITAILLLAATALSAAQATVVTTRGRVSVKIGRYWRRAYTGMRLPQGAVISTGYGAAALLRITPGWTMVRVNQFTTASIARLSQRGRTVNTRLRLRMGTIRAVVRSSGSLKSRFRISTPVATASVRGTIPEVSHFPGAGTRIAYIKGSGWVINRRGRMMLLARGQFSRALPGSTSTPFQEANLRNAAGSVMQNLTPGERRLLSEGLKGGAAAFGGMGGRRVLHQFRKRLQIILGAAFDPFKL